MASLQASSNLFYPTWTPSEGVGEGKREEVSDHRQRLYTLVEELQACDDCGAKEPKPSWVVTDARRRACVVGWLPGGRVEARVVQWRRPPHEKNVPTCCFC